MKKNILFLFTAILFAVIVVKAQNKEKTIDGWRKVTEMDTLSEFMKDNDTYTNVSKKTNFNPKIISQIPEKLKPFQGVFISTPYGDLWTKIKISGSNVKIWNAMPDDGSWGNVDEDCGLKEINGAVRIAEERSSADGSKYYSIYTSNPDGMTYFINYFPTKTQKYTFKVGQSRAYSLRKVQENYNPWK
jgi:hypothetical protein